MILNDVELMKELIQETLQRIVDTEFEKYIGVAPYERSDERRGYRNGYRDRNILTRLGRLEIRLPRDREGNFSTELFNRYQRSEKALLLAVSESYFEGVSTRKVGKIMEKLCGEQFSRSTISNICKDLDKMLDSWRNRTLEKCYPYLVLDARYENVRESGIVRKKAVMIVLGIDEGGYREILSVDIGYSEGERNWVEVFSRLKERGLEGVIYIVSDDHEGLKNAISRSFPGIIWQRCQTHFIRNFISKFSRREVKRYICWLEDVFRAPDIDEAQRRKSLLIEKLERDGRYRIAEWVDEEIDYCFGVYGISERDRIRMKSTNMLERLNQEIKRRTRVVRIFPNDKSCLRLVGMICMEYSEHWQSGRRYLNMGDGKFDEISNMKLEVCDAV